METKNDNRVANNESIVIEDLAAPDAEEIKGGPAFMKLEDIKGECDAIDSTQSSSIPTRTR